MASMDGAMSPKLILSSYLCAKAEERLSRELLVDFGWCELRMSRDCRSALEKRTLKSFGGFQ